MLLLRGSRSLLFAFEGLDEVQHRGGLTGELLAGSGGSRHGGRAGRRGFRIDVFGLEESLDSDFNKIGEAIANELAVVNDLEQVANKDLFRTDVLVGARTRKASIVLAAAGEQLADGERHGHGQHQIVSANEKRVREGTRQLLIAKTRLIGIRL